MSQCYGSRGDVKYPQIWPNAELVCSKASSPQRCWVSSLSTAGQINPRSTRAKPEEDFGEVDAGSEGIAELRRGVEVGRGLWRASLWKGDSVRAEQAPGTGLIMRY